MSSRQNRVHKLLEQGLQNHRAGNLDAAEQAYLRASEADPRNPDALNLRGVVALSTGRAALAVTLFRKASALQPSNPGLWGNLGHGLFDVGEYAESLAAYQRAARLAPDNPDFAVGIANALAASSRPDEAKRILLAIVEQRPDLATAWFALGKIFDSASEPLIALDAYQRALQADPQYGNAHLNLGVALQSLQRLDEAEQSYRRALATGAARDTAFSNLVSLLTAQGKFEAAEQIAQAAIAEFPDSAELHGLLSAACVQQGRLDAALAPAARAAQLDPENARLQMALGGIQLEANYPEQGLATLEKVRAAHPDDVHVAYIVGITQLATGHFDKGWQPFIHREVRRTKAETRPWLHSQLPQNPGNHGVRLLREQGLGDELFFLRFAPLLKTLCGGITYVTNPKLESMLARAGCFDEIIVEPESDSPEPQLLPPDPSGKIVDMLVGDLPHALYRDFGALCRTLPAPLALSALPERVDALRGVLARFGPPPYLALTWRGGIAPHEQKGKWWTLYKNIGLDDFGTMLAGLPFTLLAVQRKPLPGEIAQLAFAAGAPVHDLCDINDDLEAMLALLALVDEYVGVSNTNMHLRAGLGRGARVLVPRPSEWRWMAYGDRSPWFPGFSVYRQGFDGRWQAALAALRSHLLASPSGATGS